MNTIFIPKEKVDAYLCDLAARLSELRQKPDVWCPVGLSGNALLTRLFGVDPSLVENSVVVHANADRISHQVILRGDDPAKDLQGKTVMVIDSSVHSGGTMKAIVHQVSTYSPRRVSSYTLIMKRSARFIPALWGVTINDHDRAYFLLDRLPNNRLSRKSFDSHLRLLTESDLSMPTVTSGVEALDRVTWADRYYDAVCSEQERRTYLLEQGTTPIGYLTISRHGRDALRVDEVVVSQEHRSAGHGSTLLRWAETCARQLKCGVLDLWAIEAQVEKYVKLGYAKDESKVMNLDGEKYTYMSKRILHHTRTYRSDEL